MLDVCRENHRCQKRNPNRDKSDRDPAEEISK